MPFNDSKIIESECGTGIADQKIKVDFGEKNGEGGIMLLKFHLDSSEGKFSLAKIAFGLSRLPDAEKNVVFFYHVGNDFPSPIGMSFNCTRETALDLTDSEYSTTSVGTIRISNLQLEAFNRKNSTAFSNAIDCDAVDRFPLGKNSS